MLVGQSEYGMNGFGCAKIGPHRAACGDGSVPQLIFFRNPPCGQQSAHDNPAIKKVGQRSRLGAVLRVLERKRAQASIPSRVCEKSSRAKARFQILRLAGPLVQIQQGTYGVTGYFGGDARICSQVRPVISGNSAARFLNSGVQKPVASPFDQTVRPSKQMKIVAFGSVALASALPTRFTRLPSGSRRAKNTGWYRRYTFSGGLVCAGFTPVAVGATLTASER